MTETRFEKAWLLAIEVVTQRGELLIGGLNLNVEEDKKKGFP